MKFHKRLCIVSAAEYNLLNMTKIEYPFISVWSAEGNRVEIDAREIAAYMEMPGEGDKEGDIVRIYLKGNSVPLDLRAEVDPIVYPGEIAATLIDKVQYSHFWHDDEAAASPRVKDRAGKHASFAF